MTALGDKVRTRMLKISYVSIVAGSPGTSADLETAPNVTIVGTGRERGWGGRGRERMIGMPGLCINT
jgi:hypothetical protein